MKLILDLPEGTCRRLALHAGAEIACTAGTVWLTLEDRRRDGPPSPDIVLGAGGRHRLAEDADCFVSAPGRGESTACAVDLSGERAMARGWRALAKLWRSDIATGAGSGRCPAWRRASGSA